MQRLITLLTAIAIGVGLLAAPAAAQDAYPIDVAPIIVERPDVPPAAIPPAVDVAPPAVAAPPAAPAIPVAPRQEAQLAVTGSDVTVGAALALLLLLFGGAALWYARRRRLAQI